MSDATFSRTPFALALAAHMRSWRRTFDGSDAPMFADWTHGIYPAFRDEVLRTTTEDAVRLHPYLAALRSSQAFALNLFIPWRQGSRRALETRIARALGVEIALETVAFEWIPQGDLLGELDGDRPHDDEAATAVDVVLWGREVGGARVAFLLEVKLGEEGFSTCGGRDSRANRRRDVCASAALFFNDPANCYLRRPAHKKRDRRYWEIFARSYGSVRAAFPGADEAGPCPFAGHQQQPMRNLALAQALVQEGVVDRAWFGLCAHDQNPEVAREWATWRALLPASDLAPILPASEVVAAGQEAGHETWARWMAERYRLPLP